MAEDWVIELLPPEGVWTDITEIVDLESMGSYSYGIEDSLLEFRTGDITLRLHNDRAEFARSLFDQADPELTYRLRLNRNGVKLFEGIVELPGQVGVSENDAALELSAYGYLALLDKLSAEDVKRSFVAGPVSGAADDTELTFDTILPTRFLQEGDVLRISSDTRSEEVEVLNGNGDEVVTLKDPLSNTWSFDDSYCELITPYHRRRTITALVEELFDRAGVINPTIDMTGSKFAVPVATPINTDGLDLSKVPLSLGELDGMLRARFDDDSEYEATDAASGGFTEDATTIGGTGMPGIDDWHCYTDTQPATPVTGPPSEVSGPQGKWALGGIDYSVSPPRSWAARIRTVVGGPADTHHYELRYKDWQPGTKNWGSGTTEIMFTASTSDNGPTSCSCDIDPVRRWVYVCFEDLETNTGDLQILRYYDIALDTVTTIKTGAGAEGTLRYSFEAGLMLHLSGSDVLTGYDGVEVKFEATVPSGILLRTARYMPDAKKWVMIVRHRDRTHLLIADRLFTTQSLIDFSEAASTRTGVTVFHDDADNFLNHFQSQVTGVVNGQYVVIDTMYAGVVYYADFEGRTIAGALTELAKLVNCVVWVDNDYNGYFISRGSRIFNPDPQAPDITEKIIEQEEDLIWDKWFGRVKVTTPDGRTIAVGDAANAAGEVSIDSNLVPNLSVQHALAIAYEAYYSVARRSRTVKIDDDETIFFPLQRLIIGPEPWEMYESDYNWGSREVRLKLVEAQEEPGDESPPVVDEGPELIVDGIFAGWSAIDDATQWYEFYTGSIFEETSLTYEGHSALGIYATVEGIGSAESRPGYPTSGAGTGKGTLTFQLEQGATYRLRIAARRGSTGVDDLKWSIALYGSSGDTTGDYFAHGTGGTFDGFAAGNIDNQVLSAVPGQGLTGTYTVYTYDVLISGGGVPAGLHWASVHLRKTSAVHAEGILIGMVSLKKVLT